MSSIHLFIAFKKSNKINHFILKLSDDEKSKNYYTFENFERDLEKCNDQNVTRIHFSLFEKRAS